MFYEEVAMRTETALQLMFEHITLGQCDQINKVIGSFLLGWIPAANGEWHTRAGAVVTMNNKFLLHEVHAQRQQSQQGVFFDVIIEFGITGVLPDYIPEQLTPLAKKRFERIVGFVLSEWPKHQRTR